MAIIVAAALGYALNGWSPTEVVRWGWRIPFFIGCMIVPFIFVIRRSLDETEAFLARKHRPDTQEIFRSMVENWGIVAAGMLLVVMTTVSFYLITVPRAFHWPIASRPPFSAASRPPSRPAAPI